MSISLRQLLVAAICVSAVYAQGVPPQSITTISPLIAQYASLSKTWFVILAPFATGLFWLIAAIEWVYFGITAVHDHGDMNSLVGAIVKKLFMIAGFYTVLINAPVWIPALFDSFGIIGVRGSGFASALAPTDVLATGCWLTNLMFNVGSNAGWWENTGTALVMAAAGIMTFLAFVLITIQMIMAFVHAYVVAGISMMCLALGPSRWTRDYALRYIGLAIGCGFKLMIVELLVGAGMLLVAGWIGLAQQLPNDASPVLGALTIAASALIFLAIVWETPKLVMSVLAGTPNFSGYEMISTAASLGAMAYAGSRMVAGAAMAATGGAGGGGAAGGNMMSVSQALASGRRGGR